MNKLVIGCVLLLLLKCDATKKKASDVETINIELNKEYYVNTLMGENIEDKNITLKLNSEENRISGFSGCNSYFGDYNLTKTTIDIQNLAATKKFCSETMQLERTYLDALRKAQGLIQKIIVSLLKTVRETPY